MSKNAALLVFPGVAMVFFAAVGQGDGWTAFGFLLVAIGVMVESRSRKSIERRLNEIEALLQQERRERIARVSELRAQITPASGAQPATAAAPPPQTVAATTEQSPQPSIAAAVAIAEPALVPHIQFPEPALASELQLSAKTATVETISALAGEPAPHDTLAVISDAPATAESSAVEHETALEIEVPSRATPTEQIEAGTPIAAFTVVLNEDAVRAESIEEPVPPTPVEARVPPASDVTPPPIAAAVAIAPPAADTAIPPSPPPPAADTPRPAPTPAAPRAQRTIQAASAPPPRRSLLDFEQILGVNWLSKVGVAILVLGVTFFLAWQLRELGPLGKVVVGAIVSLVLLGAGVWGEMNERYRIVARAALAGGWSLLFFVSYATNHVAAARVIKSPLACLVLMLLVAGAMVGHTLRYRSQVVTGLAFSLAFVTIAINRADVASLSANVILAIGFSVVVVRMRWFNLEIIGIVATYLNHYMWLRPIIEPLHGKVQFFPGSVASATILILYWAIFRGSYVVRRPPEEKTSGFAGMINTALLLVVMKYQAAHADFAFWLLLALGVAEIGLARLPVMRPKRNSFVVLTVVGAALIAAAIPFRFAPAYVTPVWLIDAIVFSAAGILTSERVYRRLGTIVAAATTVQLLSFPAARLALSRFDGAPAVREWTLGFICVAVSIVLYAEAVWLPRRWPALFDGSIDRGVARFLGYAGAGIALLAGWIFFPQSGAAVMWVAVALVLAVAARLLKLDNPDLTVQATLIAIAGVARVFMFNLPSGGTTLNVPLHPTWRIVTVVAVAALLYLLSNWNDALSEEPVERLCRGGSLWAASTLVALLAWFELRPLFVVIAWTLFAFVLAAIGRRFNVADLTLQASVLAAAAIVRLIVVNMPSNETALTGPLHVSWRVVAVPMLTAVLYLLARWNADGRLTAHRGYVVAPLWAGSALVALLLWYELLPLAVVIAWTLLVLALAMAGRWLDGPHLTLQANALAAIAIARAASVNLPSDELAFSRPLHLTWRLLAVPALVAVLYLLSRWNEDGPLTRPLPFNVLPLWSATSLLVALAWFELPAASVVIAWTILGFALATFGHRLRNAQLTAQANVVAVLAVIRIVATMETAGATALNSPLHLTWRLVSVLPLAALLYSLSRWNAIGAFTPPHGHAVVPRATASALLMLLTWFELQGVGVGLSWTVFAFVLVIIGRRFAIPDLRIQANVIAAAAIGMAVAVNLPSNAAVFAHLSWRLLSVTAVAALLYFLSRSNAIDLGTEPFASAIAQQPEANRDLVRWLYRGIPMWAATALLMLLAWYELRPASVAVAWTILAVLLFEIGSRRESRDLLSQAYLILFWVFARVFVVNMNIDDFGRIGARVYTIAPIALAFLHIYRRTEPARNGDRAAAPWLAPVFAWLALTMVVALFRFQLAADTVVTGWAALALGAVAIGSLSGRRVFLHIGMAIALATLTRGAVHNLYQRSYFPPPGALDRWLWVGAAVALLAGSLPFAFRSRSLEPAPTGKPLVRAARWLDARPEQILFFIPLVLVTALITTEMRSGMLTVAWGVEAVTVFVFALRVRERSYRLSGIALLLLCVGKIFVLDFWSLGLRDKALTGIVVGLVLIGVSLLYSRRREAILQFL